jgi:hypothetical protein
MNLISPAFNAAFILAYGIHKCGYSLHSPTTLLAIGFASGLFGWVVQTYSRGAKRLFGGEGTAPVPDSEPDAAAALREEQPA